MSHADNVIQLHPTASVLTLVHGGSETSLNERKRWARRDVWRHAESRTEFYRQLLNLADVAPRAVEAGVIEANYYLTLKRPQILSAYRAAKAAQILTPPLRIRLPSHGNAAPSEICVCRSNATKSKRPSLPTRSG